MKDIKLDRSNHSGHNGTLPPSASSAGVSGGSGNGLSGGVGNAMPTVDGENIENGDHLLNNNSMDNGMTEICDVPDHVANQKRHVSSI